MDKELIYNLFLDYIRKNNIYAYDLIQLTKDEFDSLKTMEELKNILREKSNIAIESIIERFEKQKMLDKFEGVK